jgi:glycosyltransferase involved in cell wall biosynthesis
MKILVTAASSSAHISGVQRHAFNLVRCLLLNPEISRLDLILAPWQQGMGEASGLGSDSRLTIHYPEMGRGSIARNLWYYRELPELASRLRPDLVHLSYPMPIDAEAIACPTVLTLHDLYPYEIPRNFGPYQFLFNRLILQHCMHSVDAIACVSDTTLAKLKQYASSKSYGKATRIYNCVEPEPVCATQSPLPGWEGEPFLLTVAQHRRNKNIPLLIRTFHRLLRQGRLYASTRLVVLGVKGPETETIESLATQLGMRNRVLFLEGLSQAELQWCYSHCEAVVLPSMTEGFGLPVAEALLAGCRVVCSDIPVFREIGGAHCEYIALTADAEIDLAAGIKTALDKPAREPVWLPHLSAETLAKEYTGLYRALIPAAANAESTAPAASVQLATTERQFL